jgi:hypothetical protein
MKRRNTAVLAAVITAITIAFTLGSVGTATAAGLTKGAVKKIAAKVVTKKAPGLSVAHATTADTATTATTAASLQGSTADQLKTKGFTYTLPAEAATVSRRYSFPGLPVGTYLASYSYNASISAPTTVMQCQFERVGSTLPYVAPSYGVNNGLGFNRASASAILTTTSTTDLYCVTTTGTYTFPAQTVVESKVSFVAVDTLSAQASTPGARPGQPSGGADAGIR